MKHGHLMPKVSAHKVSSLIALVGLLIVPLTLDAQVENGQSQARQNLIGHSVVLRTLDKVTATTQDYTVKIGDELKYGSLTIAARHCEKKPPEEIPETYAFLQIQDARLKGSGEVAEDDRMVFSGWMFASKPAISALDHRVYDVWVIDCKIPQKPADEGLLRR
jgi:hypothetical protein